MRIPRLLLIITFPLLFILLESFLLWPKFLFLAEGLALIWLLFLIRYLAQQSTLGKKWFINALLPLLLFISLSFSLTMLTNQWLIQIIIIFLLIFLGRYLTMLYNFWVKNDLKQLERLANFSLSGGLVIIFSAISDIYSLQTFVSWSTWSLFGLAVLIIIAVIYHNWHACQLNIKENKNLFIILIILLAETVAILFFWPFNYQVLALVVTLAYYILINCTRLYLGASLNKNKVRSYLIFSAVVFLILILSARWF